MISLAQKESELEEMNDNLDATVISDEISTLEKMRNISRANEELQEANKNLNQFLNVSVSEITSMLIDETMLAEQVTQLQEESSAFKNTCNVMFKLAHRVTELEEMNDGPVADVNKAESLALDKIRHLSRENEKPEEVNKRLNY